MAAIIEKKEDEGTKELEEDPNARDEEVKE